MKIRAGILAAAILANTVSCGLFDRKEQNSEPDISWLEHSQNAISSTIYYVSPAGSDDSSGISEEGAFATLRKAIENVHPGGRVHILPGTYHESIAVEGLGDAAAYIGISGVNGIPVFDGQHSEPFGLWAGHSTHVIFDNIEFRNYTDFGIGAGESNLLFFQNLVLQDNGHAVQLKSWDLEGYGIHVDESANITISGCDVYENGPDPQKPPNYIMGTGINTYGNVNVTITYNRSHHNTGGGILVEDSEGVYVENNQIYANNLDATVDEWWDGGIWVDGGKNVILRDNNIYDNFGPGIEISDEDNQNPTGYRLEGNTCTGNYFGIFIWNFGTDTWPNSTIISKMNNDFSGNTRQDVWIEPWW